MFGTYIESIDDSHSDSLNDIFCDTTIISNSDSASVSCQLVQTDNQEDKLVSNKSRLSS